jgi:hypothetical protein
MLPDFGSMFLKGDKILERVRPAKGAGMDEAHEHVTDIGAMLGLVEHGPFPMEYGQFECPFTEVVVQRGIGHPKEDCEFVPPFEHVLHGFSEPRVGLDLLLIELFGAPRLDLLHHRSAVGLMVFQTLLSTEISLFGDGIIMVDLPELFDQVAALFGKARVYIDEIAPCMSEAV